MNILLLPFEKEIFFRAIRASGRGGQSVNKVSTKVELGFDVKHSKILTEEQKQKISEKLFQHINQKGVLKITADVSRSQYENKKIAFEKFCQLINRCFREQKKRIKTKPTKASEEERIRRKKIRSELKRNRMQKWS